MTPTVGGGLRLWNILMTSIYNTLIAFVLLEYMQLSSAIVDFYLFYDGAVDMQM